MFFLSENGESTLSNACRELDKSYSKIQRVLKKHQYRPYKILPVQELSEDHKHTRLGYCRQMLQQLDENPNFFKEIIWTDESTFSTSGVFNRQNRRSWENKNHRKRKVKQVKRSGRKSIHVWCGIFQNKIVGPIFYDFTLTRQTYLDIIIPEVNDLLVQEFPMDVLNNMIWHQDGAPPHNVLEVREHLNNQFPIWIGNAGTIRWPPNSPDLSPLDAFLWGFLKDKINFNYNHGLQEIKTKIQEEIDILNRNDNNAISNCLENLRRRYELCIANNGGHFEQFL